jgi:hypothetical protein
MPSNTDIRPLLVYRSLQWYLGGGVVVAVNRKGAFIYSSTFFGRSPAHHQELINCSGSLWFYLRIVVIVVLCSW